MAKNQRGFTLVEVLLIVLIICFVGFAGWYILDSNKQPNQATNSPETTATPTKKTESPATIPAGFKEYSNKDVEVSFAYPETWGDATIAPGEETPHLIKGTTFIISFSKNSSVKANLRSLDWEHDPNKGHDGGNVIEYASPITLAKVKESMWPNHTIHAEDANHILFTQPIGGIGCDGVATTLVHGLQGSKYKAIAFLYVSKTTNGVDSPICEGDNYKPFISQAHIDELIKLDATIKTY
jgi:hypothetical protein